MDTRQDSVAIVTEQALEYAEIIKSSQAVLLDWDGCIASDDEVDAQAIRFITEFRGAIAIVSNNSTRVPMDFVEALRPFDVTLGKHAVVLAGIEAVGRAVERNARRVMVLGNAKMQTFARSCGLDVTQKAVDTVLLLRDVDFTYDRLERAANALRHGARLIVANQDLTHPGRGGRVCPETGTLLAALMACVDLTTTDVEIIGKPAARLFERACAAVGVDVEEAVMIGDNPDTDIAGADAFGLRSILIGPRSGMSFRDLISA
jgi:HAD superfamily hydrolase (TIGR01450 family)